MPIWPIGSVEDDPQVTLRSWAILETNKGTRHFVGADRIDYSGRVSSAIVKFDANLLRGVTRSGRVYQLEGKPGRSSEADYVWQRWSSINSVDSFKDVTSDVLSAERKTMNIEEAATCLFVSKAHIRKLLSSGELTGDVGTSDAEVAIHMDSIDRYRKVRDAAGEAYKRLSSEAEE